MPRLSMLSLAVLLSLPPALAGAAEDCLALAQRDAPAALAGARKILETAPRDIDARQCEAAALFEAGQKAEAAAKFAALAGDMGDTPVAARLYAQAGVAATEAGDPAKAVDAYAAALARTPADTALRLDYGVALGGVQRYWDAIEQFDAVAKAGALDGDLYLYRAAAYRHVGNAAAAAADVEAGLRQQPDDLSLLLERAAQRSEAGQRDLAAADLRTVAAAAHPGSWEAQAAAANLTKLAQ